MAIPKRLPDDYRKLQELAADNGIPANSSADVLVEQLEQLRDNDGVNPAVEPEPEPPVKRTYVVTGEHHIVFGHLHGETFTRLIPPDKEARLIESGHIKRVEDTSSGAGQRSN